MPRLSAAIRAPRRRPLRLAWLARRHVAIAAGAAMAVTLAGGALWVGADAAAGAKTWLRERAEDGRRATARAGLAVREIVVTGRRHTTPAELVAALDLRSGEPMLGFDGAAARAELERLPWIKEARVERQFPGTVRVHLVERTPLVLWQTRARHAVLDADGQEIRGADPGAFAHLLVVVGSDAPEHARDLLALLATEPDLKARATAAVRVAARRWDVILDGETRILLPEQQAAAAWARLAEAQRRDALLERAVSQIDLRVQDRITVRPVVAAIDAPAAAASRDAARPRPATRAN